MSTSKGTPDAFTTTLAAVLREAVLDQHRLYPKLRDFKVALRAAANLSDDTAERLLNGKTSIRTDYLFHIGELLGTRASVLLAEAERRFAENPNGVPAGGSGSTKRGGKAEPNPRTGEMASKLSGLFDTGQEGIQTKPVAPSTPEAATQDLLTGCPQTGERPHAI